MEPIEIRMDLENEWQYVLLRDLLDTFGMFKENSKGEEVMRFIDWFETDEDYNTIYCVKMYDVLLWQRFLNRSRLP